MDEEVRELQRKFQSHHQHHCLTIAALAITSSSLPLIFADTSVVASPSPLSSSPLHHHHQSSQTLASSPSFTNPRSDFSLPRSSYLVAAVRSGTCLGSTTPPYLACCSLVGMLVVCGVLAY